MDPDEELLLGLAVFLFQPPVVFRKTFDHIPAFAELEVEPQPLNVSSVPLCWVASRVRRHVVL
eukprot:6315585-Prymnesium_polylepis.1